MKIYIVGTGMDGEKTLTAEALTTIERADVLIGAKRMIKPFVKLGKPMLESWRTDEICRFLDTCKCETAALLMSGDCGFYSGAEMMKKRLAEYDTEIIAGISTPVYMCARLGLSWHKMRFVSLHGNDANIVRNVRRYAECFFLLGGNITPGEICRRLCEYDTGGVKVHIGSRLAYPDERIISGTAKELTEVQCDGLCAVITENGSPESLTGYGLPDSAFVRGNVPMTKSEIRAVVASGLEVCYNDTVWDIGCGTGSVSVECALAANDGTVYAVDKNSEAAELTLLNARRFGCDNIKVLNGAAPDVLRDMPRPDKVFVGGAGGNISAIIDAACADGNKPKTVITAVTLETLNEAVSAIRTHGMSVNVTQISAVRTRHVGSHTMFDAQNPVFIIGGAAE